MADDPEHSEKSSSGPSPLLSGILVLACIVLWSLLWWPPRREAALSRNNVGHADTAAYALQARSLYRGEGLFIPYVSTFFHREDPEIRRLDDHWPPMLPLVLAAGYHLHGESIPIGHSITAALSCFALPLSVALLVMLATRRAEFALLAALPFLTSQALMMGSLKLLSDQLSAILVTLFLSSLLAGRRHPAWFLTSGCLAALCWYSKGSQILLLPILSGAVFVIHGPRALIHRWHLGAIALMLLLMAPRLQYNLKTYGKPLHSTQSYVSSFFGLTQKTWTNWDKGFYSVYWDQSELPGAFDRMQHKEEQERSFRRNLERSLRMLLLGPDEKAGGWAELGEQPDSWKRGLLQQDPRQSERDAAERPDWEPLSAWPQPLWKLLRFSGAAFGLLCLVSLPILVNIQMGFHPWSSPKEEAELQQPKPYQRFRSGVAPANTLRAMMEDAGILAVFLVGQGLFLCLFWHVMSRLLWFLLPAMSALSLMPLALVIHKSLPLLKRLIIGNVSAAAQRWISFALTSVICMGFTLHALKLQSQQLDTIYASDSRLVRKVPRPSSLLKLKGVLPDDAVFMDRNPWETLLYLDGSQRAIGFPYAEPEVVLSIARYYGVTHVLPSGSRKSMSRFFKEHPEYVERIHEHPSVLKLNWDAIPEEAFADLSLISPLWDPRFDQMPR